MRTPQGLLGNRDGDQGSIVLGWLTRLSLTLAILGIIGFEVLSIVSVKVQISDIGQTAAQSAITQYQQTHNATTAFQAASASAESQGATIDETTFVISDKSVTFDLEKVAPTLFLYRWAPAAKYADVKTTVYAEPIEAGGQLP